MMREINLKKRLWIASLLLLLLVSCAGPGANHPTGINGTNIQLPDTCWLLQEETYRLRQSARLEYLDKKEIFEGFMGLDLKQSRAHLIIFTTLGVTLLNIKIESHSFSFAETTGGESPGRQEKRFATAVATAVQRIFFSLKGHPDHNLTQRPQFNLQFSGTPPELVKLSPGQPDSDWVVTYHDYYKYPCGKLPQRIVLQSYKPAFKLTIWLNQAKKSTQSKLE